MTQAQASLSALADWIKESSAPRRSPLGDTIEVGPYAVIIPQSLAFPPTTPAPLDAEQLPLWISEAQAPANLPAFPAAPDQRPASQDYMPYRLRHLVWLFQDRRFDGVLIGLTDPSEPLQSALDRDAPGLDLNQWSVLFLPLWELDTDVRAFAAGLLPLIP